MKLDREKIEDEPLTTYLELIERASNIAGFNAGGEFRFVSKGLQGEDNIEFFRREGINI